MTERSRRFIEKLVAYVPPRDIDHALLYDLVNELGSDGDGDVVQAVLDHFERFPDAEHGAPGPLVHLVEKLDYEDALLRSVARKPTAHTLWMVNRILNVTPGGARRDELMSLLVNVESHPLASEIAKDQALHFLAHQRGEDV